MSRSAGLPENSAWSANRKFLLVSSWGRWILDAPFIISEHRLWRSLGEIVSKVVLWGRLEVEACGVSDMVSGVIDDSVVVLILSRSSSGIGPEL